MLSQEVILTPQRIEPVLTPKELKTVAFKIDKVYLNKLKELNESGYYASSSEIVRIAIFDFMAELMELEIQGGNYWEEFGINKKENTHYEKMVPFSVKIPITMFNNIVKIVKRFNFKNRSVFIRIALHRFLFEQTDDFLLELPF